MSRINLITNEHADEELLTLYHAITKQFGKVPNFIKVFANSPTALKAFLGLYTIANEGSLDTQTKNRIALALAQHNECQYCVSAHTTFGSIAGLTGAEMEANREGSSQDAKGEVAVKFAKALAEHKGKVTAAELSSIRKAGFSESDIVEIITHVGMNIMVNIIGRASRVAIDFPKVELTEIP